MRGPGVGQAMILVVLACSEAALGLVDYTGHQLVQVR